LNAAAHCLTSNSELLTSVTRQYVTVVVYHTYNPLVSVIGGGPYGLSFGYNSLKMNKHTNWQIFEAADHYGGLAASITDENGFTWDWGGHVTFDPMNKFFKMLDDIGLEYYSKKRNAKVWYKDRMIDYPIQMHIW